MSARSMPYRLESARLVLRALELDDTSPLHTLVLANREHLARWMPWAREELTLDGYLEFVRGRRSAFDCGEDFGFGAFDRETGELLGSGGLHPRCGVGGLEVGYWIAADRCGAGLATEVAAVLTRTACEHMGVQRVELRVQDGNVPSRRVAEKLGFQLEGTLRNRLKVGGAWVDLDSYSLLPEEARSGPVAEYAYEAFDGLGRPVELA